MKQESFSDMEYRCRKKKTKLEEFVEIMDEIIPWMYLLQCWFNLSDEGVEDAIYDSCLRGGCSLECL